MRCATERLGGHWKSCKNDLDTRQKTKRGKPCIPSLIAINLGQRIRLSGWDLTCTAENV